MQTKTKNKNTLLNMIVLLCCAAYFVSYLTRKNYSVAISAIAESTGLAKSALGSVESALLIFYAIGQIVSGFLGDRIKPQNLVFFGTLLSTVCNAVFPLFDSVNVLIVIWAINGFAQAMFWPPIVKIIALYLSPSRYKLACSHVSVASQIATVAMYLIIPLILEILNYKWVFWLAALSGLIMSAIWIILYNRLIKNCSPYECESEQTSTDDKTTAPENKIKLWPILLSCGIITILLSIITQGFLRDGITTWMPDFVMSHSDLKASKSILMNVLMPIFSICVTYLGTFVYSKIFHNELVASTVFFLIATLPLGTLFVINGVFSAPPVISVILAALVVGLMHCVNLTLITYVPARFTKYGAVGFLSGLTNAFTYVGSAVSTSVTAIFSETFGWDSVLVLWIGIALAGTLLCLFTIKRWHRFTEKNVSEPETATSQKQ